MYKLDLSHFPELKSDLKIKALQFGEGNFLRGFIDWMLQRMNQQGLFNGRVLAVQPTPQGRVIPRLKDQDFLYTTVLSAGEGQPEQIEIVNVIADALNPYTQWPQLLEAALLPDLQVVFSNTTEAGITYEKSEFSLTAAPLSFPAKLTILLYVRFKAFRDACRCGGGLTVLPCELIENNGSRLKQIVLHHAADWELGAEFKAYLEEDCRFLNTVVDRVVSGYPVTRAMEYEGKTGYIDSLMTCGELYGFMAIESDPSLEEILPFAKAGLNVITVPDIRPYHLTKERILNGAHSACAPAGFLMGLDNVNELLTHAISREFTRSVIFDEIIPGLNLKFERKELHRFAEQVLQRWSSPVVHYQLSNILLNCAAKMRERVIPSILDLRARGILPRRLCFALASFIALYRAEGSVPVKVLRAGGRAGYFREEAYAAQALHRAFDSYTRTEASALFTVKAVLSDLRLWGTDLSADVDLTACVAKLLHAVLSDGAEEAMRAVLAQN